MRQFVVAVIAAIAMVGCFKETAFRTEYIISPSLEAESGGERSPLSGVKAYAFGADTANWKPVDYTAAFEGIVTNEAGKTLSPIATAAAFEGSETKISMVIESEKVMLLVVDTYNECYAYTDYELGENLPQTYVSLLFRSWKNTANYKDGAWYFIPTVPEEEPQPESQE